MANGKLLSGRIYVKVNGVQQRAKGSFTYNLGKDKREAVVGADGIHGYKATPQVPFIEGKLTDNSDLDLAALQSIEDATITLELANGKTIVLRNGWYASEGNVETEEAEIDFRMEGMSAEEMK